MKLTPEAEVATRSFRIGCHYKMEFKNTIVKVVIKRKTLEIYNLVSSNGIEVSHRMILIATKTLVNNGPLSPIEVAKMQIIYGDPDASCKGDFPEFSDHAVAVPNLFKFLESIGCKIEMLT